jgi:hypothetical protein
MTTQGHSAKPETNAVQRQGFGCLSDESIKNGWKDLFRIVFGAVELVINAALRKVFVS